MTASRVLVTTHRTIGVFETTRYDRLWSDVRAAAAAAGANAWRFRSTAEAAEYVEFLEYRVGLDPRRAEPLAGSLAELDRVLPGRSTEWIDSTEPSQETR